MMRKGHPLLPEINRVIDEQNVYFMRSYRKYIAYKHPSNCSAQNYQPKPLSKKFIWFFENLPNFLALEPFYVVLLLFMVGLALGLCSFFVELYVKKYKVVYY